MRKYEKYMLESSELMKKYLIELLAAEINLYYKYYKNKNFESFEQYCNSFNSSFEFTENEMLDIYHKVDTIMQEKYELFFAHYELENPIYLVDISGKEESE